MMTEKALLGNSTTKCTQQAETERWPQISCPLKREPTELVQVGHQTSKQCCAVSEVLDQEDS